MATRLDAIIDLSLLSPLDDSSAKMELFCVLWNCRIVEFKTRTKKAKIAMAWPAFKKIFKKNPVVGKYAVPTPMKKWVESVAVSGIVILQLRGHA